eukprot:m.482837 g.482837  ORF g.482837 m.482837 type:complete len:203 (-) comp22681_c0_seq1:25-633(-)
MATVTLTLALGVLLLCALVEPVAPARNKALWCGACKGLLDEIEFQISQADPYKRIDVGTFRIDDSGNKRSNSITYARSETFLIEVLETVCAEMKNYSEFTADDGTKTYRRYQNRPGVTKPLELATFGWSVDVQEALRMACDSIAADIEDDLIEFYQTQKDLDASHDPAARVFCKNHCKEVELPPPRKKRQSADTLESSKDEL